MTGPITLDAKHAGERSAGKPPAPFDEAGAGNVAMAAGLRASAKALEHPPEPNVGAPDLDPTVGGCGFKGSPKSGTVEIGYAVAPSAQGQGAATSAVQLLLARAFSNGAHEVIVEVNPTNQASLRVVEKAGFSEIGTRVDESNEYVTRWVKRGAA